MLLLRLTVSFLGQVARDRSVRRLLLLLILGTALLAGTRLLVLRAYAPVDDDPWPIVFYETPIPGHLGMVEGIFQGGWPAETHAGALLTVNGEESTSTALSSTSTLQVVAMLILPIVALVLGTVFVPQRHALRLLLHGLPAQRITVYGAMALATGIAWTSTVVLILIPYLGIAAFQPRAGAWLSLFARYGLSVFLHGGLFAALGLALASLYRRRATALIIGLGLLLAFGIMLPTLKGAWNTHWSLSTDLEYRREIMRGERPWDLSVWGFAILARVPTSALLSESMATFSEANEIAREGGCPSCRRREDPLGFGILVGTPFLLLLGGAIAYVRREEET